MGGKVTRLKGDLDDVDALLEIMNILKDVATNRFYIFAQRKVNFQKFLEAFLDYFSMLSSTKTTCPLVQNDNPNVDILVVASDQSFMGQLNGRVTYAAFQEYQKHKSPNVVCISYRAAEKMRLMGMNLAEVFVPAQFKDRFEITLKVRDYLVERMLSGKTGKVVVVHLWAKSFSILKPRVITLLPAKELLSIESQEEGEEPVLQAKKAVEFIEESTVDHIMTALADIWVHSRIFEIVSDVELVEFAVMAQQLESALEGLSSEKKALMVNMKKASRDELNKSMREVFTSSSMAKAKGK